MELFSENQSLRHNPSPEVLAQSYQVEKFLETVDMETLNLIMEEILERSGVDTQKQYIKQNVAHEPSRKASGWHENREIFVNASKYDFNDDYKKDYRRILSAYIHEYVHAVAAAREGGSTGFQQTLKSGEKKNLPINEGFTELIADYVYEEYLSRTGEAVRLGHTSHKRTVKGYFDERADASALIEKMSQDSGIPEDVVFGAYIRAYFSRDLDSLDKSLEEVYGNA